MRASTARLALDAGAKIVNDVSGGLADTEMFATVASFDADCVIMHWRAHSVTMDDHANYGNVVADVAAELKSRVDAAIEAGISSDKIFLDPGLGFAKSSKHNWDLLNGLEALSPGGNRILLGASRKRFLGDLVREEHKPEDRDGLSAVLGVLAATAGVSALRVHNVKVHREALDLWQAFRREAQV
jgi:dihydropteroate synthase